MAKKINPGKETLLSFLEEVEKDKFDKKGTDKTKQLVDYMTSKKRGHDDSDEVATKVAMNQAELKKGKPDNPRVDEENLDEAAFSRQHYQAIAKILKDAQDTIEKGSGATEVVEFIAQDLIALFKQDNPRFDASKFAKAAGTTDVGTPESYSRE